ncbi:hypothetical protein EDF46_1215 [Frondihabitans sp. PhB188]|uniref:hypothetical protein n=1 Tax=Frondihabitans sp. PhB188 TaxID=2485200 RepID=UPI000F461CF1|nr:hypothetical protein [Frondihabitans sp. PhB188]ROQ39583.1 hypothetical protein EDF46_1215 [Frondihabitans sp. PhB188]
MTTDRFVGRIAGVGTESGTRLVVGLWNTSPLGSFADVMVETGSGHRVLLAPREDVAHYISATYEFDEVRVLPVEWRKVDGGILVEAGPGVLRLRLGIGGISPLGRLLRAVPRSVATRPAWLRLINPVAKFLLPGSATAGTAGGGRREYYGVTLARRVASVEAEFDAQELGALAPLDPPVRFGFGSAPRDPSLVDVTTTIRS